MASLTDRLASDLKEAMKARDQVRLDTLRSVLSGFTYKRAESGAALSEQDETDVVRRLVKQRSDAQAEYEKAGRTDLAQKERTEREILLAYLPAQKSEAELREVVVAAIQALPSDARNQGSVMKSVMPQLRGLADGNLVRQIVAEELDT